MRGCISAASFVQLPARAAFLLRVGRTVDSHDLREKGLGLSLTTHITALSAPHHQSRHEPAKEDLNVQNGPACPARSNGLLPSGELSLVQGNLPGTFASLRAHRASSPSSSASNLPGDRRQCRPLRRVISPVLFHHPHRTVAKLRRELFPCIAHHGSFSQIGASGKAGAVQGYSAATECDARAPDRVIA